jgi:hypothetical protein
MQIIVSAGLTGVLFPCGFLIIALSQRIYIADAE